MDRGRRHGEVTAAAWWEDGVVAEPAPVSPPAGSAAAPAVAPTGPNGGGKLTPFRPGDPRAAAAGRKGAEVRRARRDVQRGTSLEVAEHLATMRESFDRGELG